jgi:hypothetical protein
MTAAAYRIESAHPIIGPQWSGIEATHLHRIADRALAIVLAAKSRTRPWGHEIRVVHVPTGEVVFRKTDGSTASANDEC